MNQPQSARSESEAPSPESTADEIRERAVSTKVQVGMLDENVLVALGQEASLLTLNHEAAIQLGVQLIAMATRVKDAEWAKRQQQKKGDGTAGNATT